MDPTQVEKAVESLMKHCRAKESSSLTETDAHVYVQVVFKRVPNKTKHPVKLTLKNSIYNKEASVCLITKDPQRYYKDLMKTNNISVAKVIGVGKLKKKYKELEAKRILCDSHDVFLVDDRVLPIIPRWFGSYFYRKGKAPVKVNLKKKNLKQEVESCTRSYMVANLGKGNNLSIPCGRVSFDNELLSENLHSALNELCANVRPGWKNVKAVYLKTESSVALPVYSALDSRAFKITE
ncbi:ribosomal L1 domain-containing protein 1-like [Bolinopsis microptera]|uniref:ribosomal L1 domain-containing protein 1-like n=1 Tax=Bolinopsis microptera TaxID=2820187 RepID=UPI00307A0045